MRKHLALLHALMRAFLLIAALGALAAGCRREEAKKERPPPLVAIQPVEVRDVPVEIRAPSDLRPVAVAEVGAKTLGYLDAVLVDRGDRVHRGQVLAVVRPSDLPDQLAAARGQLASAQAALSLARSNAQRVAALGPSGVVSQQDQQQAAAQLQSAEAAAAAARANLGGSAARLGETRLISTLDGYVADRKADPGTLVGPSTGPVLTLMQTNVLRAYLQVNERESAGLLVGQPGRVEVDALPGRVFSGRVSRIAPSLDPGTRTLLAELELPNRDGLLRAGMYGRAAIEIDLHRHSVVVPAEAVELSGGRSYAYVVTPQEGSSQVSVVHRRKLVLGVDGGAWLEVTAGLQPGDQIVSAGLEGLEDGSKVRTARNIDPFSGETTVRSAGPDKGSEGKNEGRAAPDARPR